MLYNLPDGNLTITETSECAAYVQLENHLAGGATKDVIETDQVIVTITKGAGELPETMLVYDKLTGVEYTQQINDHETGAVCVPYWMGM